MIVSVVLIVVGVILGGVCLFGGALDPTVRWAIGATGMVCLFGGWDRLDR